MGFWLLIGWWQNTFKCCCAEWVTLTQYLRRLLCDQDETVVVDEIAVNVLPKGVKEVKRRCNWTGTWRETWESGTFLTWLSQLMLHLPSRAVHCTKKTQVALSSRNCWWLQFSFHQAAACWLVGWLPVCKRSRTSSGRTRASSGCQQLNPEDGKKKKKKKEEEEEEKKEKNNEVEERRRKTIRKKRRRRRRKIRRRKRKRRRKRRKRRSRRKRRRRRRWYWSHSGEMFIITVAKNENCAVPEVRDLY